MAARVEDEDAVGRAVAADLLAERRRSSGDASRPSDDPTSSAWFETALRSIRGGRCHAYCAAPGMPSAVLWSAWEALGPPPPPDQLGSSEESADPEESAGGKWRALLESSTLASCARCVRAYRARVDRWDAAAETARTEEEHDAAVLAALLRERDDARLGRQAESSAAAFAETSSSSVTLSARDAARLDATLYEAFFFAGAMESPTAVSLKETVADLAVAAGAARVAAALERASERAESLELEPELEPELEVELEPDEPDPEDADGVAPRRLSLGDAPGAFEFLAHPRREDVRRTMEACFRLATTSARRRRETNGGVFARPVRAASAPVAAIVAGWAETVWRACEAGQNGSPTSGGPTSAEANANKAIAWRALAVASRASRAALRSRVLDLHPELVDAALDELSAFATNARAPLETVEPRDDERVTERTTTSKTPDRSPGSVAADAARVIAELVSADAGTYWADPRSAPMTAACAVLESAARRAPERSAHEACVAAVSAALFSASSAADDDAVSEASRRKSELAEGSTRATEFLCSVVPGAPHLFDERVAWRARRAAMDVVRAGYQAGRPPCEPPRALELWLRTLGEAGKRPPAAHANRDSAVDRAAARVSAAAATASALRADAAALAALEHARARGGGGGASFFFPDVDGFAETSDGDGVSPSLDAASRDAASLLGTYFWEDGADEDPAARAATSRDGARFREGAHAAFAARAQATARGAWRCAAATRVAPLTEPFFVPGATSDASSPHTVDDGVVVSATLAAAAELALAPSEEKREARGRSGNSPPPAPPATSSADAPAVSVSGDASRLATRMAADLGDALVAFTTANAYPLARAASPGDAIRAAVALFLGQRDALRAAGKALLVAQALGPGNVSAAFPATGANVEEVWTRVCAFPESRRAALEGATLAARAAAAAADPGDRLAAAAQVAHHARRLLVAAEAADVRDADEARTLAAAASRRDSDAARACASLRVALVEAAFELVAESAAEAADRADETWAQGDLIKAFRAFPGLFATWSRRRGRSEISPVADSTDADDARSRAARAGDRATALWWVPGCLRLCGARRAPAVTRHWRESLDATLAASVETGVFASVADFPAEAKAAARGAFAALETRRRRASSSDASDDTASATVRDVLARHFPSEAPGNLGVGLLEGLPSRSRTAAKPARPVFVTDEAERAEALYESRRTKPSLRERLATSALAPTAAERDGDGRVRGGGGFAADPLDSWNADRGGFAAYPADADEPDVGDAIVVDEDDVDDDEGFEILDRFGDAPPVARARGLGPAVEDRLRARSPYERSLSRARADAGSSVNRRGGRSGGTTPSLTNADILAGVRAGGPTHKPKKTSVVASSFAGRRDFGSSSGAFAGATVAAVREASAAKEGVIRERAELASKRERERAEAKAAREKRLAEKHWEREHVIALDGAGEPPSRTAAEVVHLAPAAAGKTGFDAAFHRRPNRFGGVRGRSLGPGLRNANAALLRRGRYDAPPEEPPWAVPECDDLVAVALRWSAAHALRAADRAAAEDDAFSAPPETFPSGRAYVEHFAPLLLAELRAQIGSSMEEAGGVAPGVPAPGVVESVAAKARERSAFHVARVALGRSREGAASSFQENDFVLLEKKNATTSATERASLVDVASRDGSRRTTRRYHAFGVVEGVETGAASKSWSGASVGGKSSAEDDDSRVLLKIRVCLVEDALSPTTRWLTGNGGGPVNAPDERERRDGVLRAVSRRGAAVTVSRVASLTPPLREMAALLATCRAGGFAGAASAFLRPSRAAPETTALFAGTRAGDLPPPPEGADAAAWASTMAGLNPPQRDAVRAAASVITSETKRGSGSGGATTQTRVVLVQGPPGTGKTRVIAATVEAVLAGSGSGGAERAASAKTKPAPPGVVLSPAKYGAAAVAARRRQDDRRRRMSVDGGAKTNETVSGAAPSTSAVDPSRRRRILVCAQSNSAVDELVARLAGAFGARGDRTLVRLGREEVTREDALPFLVTRLVDDRRRAESAEIGRGEARAAGGGGGGGGASVGNAGPSSADASASATRARLERLGEEIRAEESKESSRFGVSGVSGGSGVSSARGVASVHLDMLHAQRRRLLGELAALKQSEKSKSGVDASSSAFGGSGVSSAFSSRGSSAGGGSTWSRVVAGADVVCATLSGAGLLAADHRAKGGSRTGAARFGGFAPGATEKDDAAKLCAVPLFDAVIVDEAAQATELATLIPLRWLRPGGVAVLVGDPKQLAPTVLAKSRAVERCLSRSLFERMQRAGARAHLLSVQYRMHPSIRAFPSNRFYGSRLVDGTPAGSLGSPLGANYACVDCAGGYEIRRRSVSNPVEVSVCVALYAQLLRNLRASRRDAKDTRVAAAAAGGGGGATFTTVGVVTPYRDQLDALRRGFARVTETNPESRLAPVEFATVDGVQGREFDVVLFSCVRANETSSGTKQGVSVSRTAGDDSSRAARGAEFTADATRDSYVDDASPADVAAALRSRRAIGFLADKRRLNVALTRPRLALVVVGHAATLRAADGTWRSLWDDAERRGAAVEVAGSGASARDALFSFRADGTGALNVAKETSVPEAVVDLAGASSSSSEDDADPELETREPSRSRPVEAVRETSPVEAMRETSRSRPVEAVKRGRGAAASAAGVPAKRAKPLPPKPATARVRPSVPVAPVASVMRREKKVTTTRAADTTARARVAAATARAKATLEAGASGGRASASRVVAPPAKKKKTTDLVGSILKGMRRE